MLGKRCLRLFLRAGEGWHPAGRDGEVPSCVFLVGGVEAAATPLAEDFVPGLLFRVVGVCSGADDEFCGFWLDGALAASSRLGEYLSPLPPCCGAVVLPTCGAEGGVSGGRAAAVLCRFGGSVPGSVRFRRFSGDSRWNGNWERHGRDSTCLDPATVVEVSLFLDLVVACLLRRRECRR